MTVIFLGQAYQSWNAFHGKENTSPFALSRPGSMELDVMVLTRTVLIFDFQFLNRPTPARSTPNIKKKSAIFEQSRKVLTRIAPGEKFLWDLTLIFGI